MKPIVRLLLILLSGWPVACEYNTDSQQLPYKERLVIDGLLEAPAPGVQYVTVSRTLPLNENNSMDKGRLTNANVFLSYDDTTAQLYYQHGAYDNDSVRVLSGRTYTLTVEWNGKRAYATTLVPYPAVIDTAVVVRQEAVFIAEATITPREGEVYISSWTVSLPFEGTTRTFAGQVLTRQDAANDGRIHFSCVLQSNYRNADSLTFNCESYDWPYYDYYLSSGDPSLSGVPTYSYFAGPVRWNVQGDGVGLFVAHAHNLKTVAFP